MSDLVTRLILQTQQFDNNLTQSTKQIQQFQQRINSFSSGAISAFKKFAGVVGIAIGGMETFKKIIDSSQTTSDLFTNNLNAAKGSVESFFRSLSTGDWSVFQDGIVNSYKRLYDLSVLMDELADKKLSLSYIKAEDLTNMEKFEQIAKDTTKSLKERQEAAKSMQTVINDLNSKTRETIEAQKKAVVEGYNAQYGNSGLQFTEEDITTFVKDTNFGGELTEQVKKYQQDLKDIKKSFEVTTNTPYGSQTNYTKGWKEAVESYKQQNLFLEKQSKLLEETDEGRIRTVGLLKENLSLEKEIYSLQKRADETIRSTNNQPTTTKLTTTEIIPEGSLLDARKKIESLKKELEKATDDGVRIGLNKAIAASETELRMMLLRSTQTPLKVPVSIEIKEVGKKVNKKVANAIQGGKLSGADITRNTEPVEIVNNDNLASAIDYIQTFSSITSSLSGITDSASGAWLQYTANIISGIAAMLPALASLFGIEAALGIAEQSKLVFPMNVIAMAATGVALAATIASLPKFADGGIVGGSSFIGDTQLARVNSGEMILNGGQQKHLFNLLDGNSRTSISSGEVTFRISGKELVGVINNHNRKTSKY